MKRVAAALAVLLATACGGTPDRVAPTAPAVSSAPPPVGTAPTSAHTGYLYGHWRDRVTEPLASCFGASQLVSHGARARDRATIVEQLVTLWVDRDGNGWERREPGRMLNGSVPTTGGWGPKDAPYERAPAPRQQPLPLDPQALNAQLRASVGDGSVLPAALTGLFVLAELDTSLAQRRALLDALTLMPGAARRRHDVLSIAADDRVLRVEVMTATGYVKSWSLTSKDPCDVQRSSVRLNGGHVAEIGDVVG